MDLQYKSLQFQVKSLDDSGDFQVYAAVFGNVDLGGDVIVPGAFRNLDAFVTEGFGAFNHRMGDLPIATVDSAVQDAHGLLISGKFHTTSCAQEARTVIRERMERGKSVGASFGYETLDCGFETRDGERVRILKAINIYEFSFVNMPMNPSAQFTDAKGLSRLSEVKGLIAEVKAGRSMSKARHAYLKSVHDSMAPAIGDLKALLDAHDPDGDGDGDTDAGAEAVKDEGDESKSRSQADPSVLVKARAELSLLHHHPIFARATSR